VRRPPPHEPVVAPPRLPVRDRGLGHVGRHARTERPRPRAGGFTSARIGVSGARNRGRR
jgi:hypothetical protein